MIGVPVRDCPESEWEDPIKREVERHIALYIQDIEYLESRSI